MLSSATVSIDTAALRHNFQQVRKYAPNQKILAVIKANAYGHGMLPIADALADAEGFAVARLSEAIALRDHGISNSIVLLEGVYGADELALAQHHRLDLVVHQAEQVDQLLASDVDTQICLWLKMDSGMHRLGFQADEFETRYAQLSAAGWNVRLMTHLACADDLDDGLTKQQLEQFERSTTAMQASKSVANSAGIVSWPESHHDWVRPGIMLYGASPVLNQSATALGLKPVMHFRSGLIAVKNVAAGESIGYGASYRCEQDTRIGIVAAGYADGYPRHAASGTPVLINDVRCGLVGRVSMDMIAVDLTAAPKVCVGDEVTLWGPGLPAEEVALAANTIAYDLFCGIGSRVSYGYID